MKPTDLSNSNNPRFAIGRAAVFGAAHGIGEAIASHLNTQASLLAAIDHDPSFSDTSVPDPLAGHYRLRADVRDRVQVETALAGFRNRSFDAAFFSAGIQDDEQPELTFRVNVEGTKHSFAGVFPLLRIGAFAVFLSSDRITFEAPSESPYVRSKRGIADFATALAERRDDLHVLILLPGPVDTALFRKNKSEELLSTIEREVGILSPTEFTRMLFQDVIPHAHSHKSGAAVRMYKKAGVEWLDSI